MSIVDLLQEELRLGHILEDDWSFDQFHGNDHEPFLFCLHQTEIESSPCHSPAPPPSDDPQPMRLKEPAPQTITCDISKATLSCHLSRGDKWSTKSSSHSRVTESSETAYAIAIRDGHVIT